MQALLSVHFVYKLCVEAVGGQIRPELGVLKNRQTKKEIAADTVRAATKLSGWRPLKPADAYFGRGQNILDIRHEVRGRTLKGHCNKDLKAA